MLYYSHHNTQGRLHMMKHCTTFRPHETLKERLKKAAHVAPSPAQLKDLIDCCRKENIHVIFVQQEFDQRNAQLIADELGVKVVSINPLSYNWTEEMLRVAKALQR